MPRKQSEEMAKVQKAVTHKIRPMTVKDACAKYGAKENSVYKSAWWKAYSKPEEGGANA